MSIRAWRLLGLLLASAGVLLPASSTLGEDADRIGAYRQALGPPILGAATPALGGTLADPATGLTVTFPPGAVTEPVTVSLTPLRPWNWGPPNTRMVTMFELKATKADGSPVTQFAQDVQISYLTSDRFDEEELRGLDPQTLGFHTLNESTLTWEPLPTTRHWEAPAVSPPANSASPGYPVKAQGSRLRAMATTRHFSIFGGGATPTVTITVPAQSFQTDLFTGSATANIPLELPKGPAGFRPNLNLHYSSAGVNEMQNKRDVGSWVGIGWSLSPGAISYSPSLDGFLLELNGKSYWLVYLGNQTWKTQQDSDIKVVGSPVTNEFHNFEAWDGDGNYYIFGAHIEESLDGLQWYADGYQTGTPCTYTNMQYIRWNLIKARDTQGNTAAYKYSRDVVGSCGSSPFDAVSAYVSEITWGLNINVAGSADRFQLQTGFLTETGDTYSSTTGHVRADNPGSPLARVRENRKLGSLMVNYDSDGNGSFETRVRKWVFGHSTTASPGSSAAGRYTLTSLQEFGVTDNDAFPATTFTYTDKNTYLRDTTRPDDSASGCNPCNPATFTWPFLTSISTGYGGTVSYTYTALPATAVDNDLQRQTVTQHDVNPGIGTTQTTTFSYTGSPVYKEETVTPPAQPDPYKDEFRGFGQVRRTDAAGNYSEHYFYTKGTAPDGKDADKLKGREWKTEYKDSGGNLLKRIENDWIWATTVSPSWYVLLQKIDVTEGQKTKRAWYTYDAYFQVIQEVHKGDIYDSTDDLTIFRQFNANTSTHLHSRLQWEKVYAGTKDTDDGVGLKTEKLHFYDGSNNDNQNTTPPVRGILTRVKTANVIGSTWINRYFTYDLYGNRLTEQDPNGNTTTWTYDTAVKAYPLTETYPTVGGLTMSESATWDYGGDVMLSWTDANGQTTSYQYDGLKRMTKLIRRGDSTTYPTQWFNYPSWGTINSQHVESNTKITDTTWLWTKGYFDGLGRVVQTHAKGETVGATNYIILTTQAYSSRGLLDKAYVPQKVDASMVTGYTAPGGGWLYALHAYDALGRETTKTNPDTTTVTATYTEWQSTVTNERGYKKRYTTDAFGRLAKVEELNASHALYATTTYAYDVLGNLTTVTDNAGNQTTLTYNALSRKTAMADPDMGSWSYVYDANGNLTSQTDAKSQTLLLEYDALNRLTRTCTPTCAGTVLATYSYDATAGGNQGKGRRTGMTDSSGSTANVYDSRGRLTQQTKTIDGTGYVTSYGYDAADRNTTITYPSGEVVTNTYDGRGMPYTISSTVEGNIITSGGEYNALGQLTFYRLGSGVGASFKYWGLEHNAGSTTSYGRLYEIKAEKAGTTIQQLQHTWDNAGNLSSRTNTVTSETENFTYDFLDRLTAVSGAYSESYTYNEIGNLMTKGAASYTYGDSAHKHAVTSAGGVGYAYDANGNMTTRGTQTLTWDVFNRVTAVTGGASFVYDGDGRRVKKAEGGETVVYPNKYYEKNVTTGVVTKYYFLGSKLVAIRSGTTWEDVHQDHLGGTNVTNDSYGAVKTRLAYYPFGGARSTTGTPLMDVKFTGQRLDQTGLYFYNARYYDANLGRFVSADPVGTNLFNPQTLNRYSYVVNNPLKYTDPSGNFHRPADEAFVAAVLGAYYAGANLDPNLVQIAFRMQADLDLFHALIAAIPKPPEEPDPPPDQGPIEPPPVDEPPDEGGINIVPVVTVAAVTASAVAASPAVITTALAVGAYAVIDEYGDDLIRGVKNAIRHDVEIITDHFANLSKNRREQKDIERIAAEEGIPKEQRKQFRQWVHRNKDNAGADLSEEQIRERAQEYKDLHPKGGGVK